MSCEKGLSLLLLRTSDSMTWAPKIDKFLYFILPLPLKVTLFSKSPYLTAHIKINYETGCIGRFSGKTQRSTQSITTAKMELFVELASSFYPLPNFTKNHNIGAMGVLNVPLEYYNIFQNLYRCKIKYCRTVACNFSKNNPFYRLINYSNASSDCINISYPIRWFFIRAWDIQLLSKEDFVCI